MLTSEGASRRSSWARVIFLPRRSGALSALVVATALLLLCATAAHAGTLATLGFDPAKDGYRFPNYTNAGAVQNLTASEMQRLFGPAVCVSGSGASCVLSPQATQWMATQNTLMADGHCEGFAVSALIFFRGLVSPSVFSAPSVPSLAIKRNAPLQSFIAYAYAFQALQSVRHTVTVVSPKAVVAKLIAALPSKQTTLHIYQPDNSGGHAITPIAVRDLGDGQDAIDVYDNNFPGKVRSVLVDVKHNSWRYFAATDPSIKGALYQGDASTFTLTLETLDPGLPVQPCPFCQPAAALSALTTAPAPTGAASTLVALRATGERARHAHLRVRIDGRRGVVGYDRRGRFVHTLRGVRTFFPTQGGPHVWRGAPEPQYNVPGSHALSVELDASAMHGKDTEALAVIGRGWNAGVERIKAVRGVAGIASTSATGTDLAFTSRATKALSPTLRLGSDQAQADLDFAVSPHRLVPQARFGIGVRAATGKLTIAPATTGTNTVDVALERLGRNGRRDSFTHRNVVLHGGQAATLDVAHWRGDGSPLTLEQGGVSRSLTDDVVTTAPATPPAAEPAPPPAGGFTPASAPSPPTATIAQPRNNITIPQGTTLQTDFSCAEGAGGPGLASCVDSNGTSAGKAGILDTSTTGAHTYTVTATSRDGQTGTASISYTVTPVRVVAYVSTTGNTVTPVDLGTGQPGTPIGIGGTAFSLAATPDASRIYTANYGENTVTAIDVTSNTAGTPIPVAGNPNAIAITPDGNTAYVADNTAGAVTPIDLSTNTPGTPIPVGSAPYAIAVTPDGSKVYVTDDATNTITPIDTATNTPGTPFAVPGGNNPRAMVMTPDGAKAFVANQGGNTVTPIDIASNTAGTPIAVGNDPTGITVTPDGKTVYVANYMDGTVTPIDVATLTAGPAILLDQTPFTLAVTPDGASLVAGMLSSDELQLVGVATGTPQTPIRNVPGPRAIVVLKVG